MADDTPFLIINPNSRNAKTRKDVDKILTLAKNGLNYFSYELTKERGDGTVLAMKARNEGYNTIVAVGGDGTLNEVVNVAVNTDIKVGMISRGCSCDSFKTYGIPRNLRTGLEIISAGYSERFPVGFARDKGKRCFINRMGGAFIGSCADASHYRFKWINSDMRYKLLAALMAPYYNPVPSKITVDQHERSVNLSAMGVALGSLIAGTKFIPGNHPRKGDFAVIVIRDTRGIESFFTVLRAIKGGHLRNEKTEILRGKKVVVESKRSIIWEVEGEIFSKGSTRVEIEYVPNAINLIIPEGLKYGIH